MQIAARPHLHLRSITILRATLLTTTIVFALPAHAGPRSHAPRAADTKGSPAPRTPISHTDRNQLAHRFTVHHTPQDRALPAHQHRVGPALWWRMTTSE